MKKSLFEYPSYQYQIDDWKFKKKSLLNRINSQKFVRTEFQKFETDRQTNNKSYIHYFRDLISPQLLEFYKECDIICSMVDCWTVKYQKGDYQTIHNHRSWGFSGILYVEFDNSVHSPTSFVAPWQDPRSDMTCILYPQDITEGTLIIFPSYTLHFVTPNNSNKRRTIVSFDLLPLKK